MKQYKYKVEYKTFAGKPKDVKVEDYTALQDFLGNISMIMEYAFVSQKIKGQYELIRSINGSMYYQESK